MNLDVIILPAFDDVPGLPGEASPWEEHYQFSETIQIPGAPDPLQVSTEGVGLIPTGIGKANAAATVTGLLASERVDCSAALFLTVGVAGGPPSLSVGSVVVSSAIVDWDMKCRFDGAGSHVLAPNPYVDEPVYDLAPTQVEEALSAVDGDDDLAGTLAGEDSAVVAGANVCGDELWHGRAVAEQVESWVGRFDCGPYRATEMEDAGTARALERFGRLGDYVSIRGIANPDRPPEGTPPRTYFGSDDFEAGFKTGLANAISVATAVISEKI